MADSFVRITLQDGSTHTVVVGDADPAAMLDTAARGQRWVEGGGAVTRRLVAAAQVVQIELFDRA